MKILKNNPIWDFLLQIKFFSFSTQVIIIFKICAINIHWMKYFRINLFIQFVIPTRKTFLYHCLYHNFLLFVSFCWNIFSWRNPGFNSGKYRHWLSRFSFWKRKNAVAALNHQEVLEKIPSDDKEILDFLNSYYYWYIVFGLPVGFFLLMLYQIGEMYGENVLKIMITKHFKWYSSMNSDIFVTIM